MFEHAKMRLFRQSAIKFNFISTTTTTQKRLTFHNTNKMKQCFEQFEKRRTTKIFSKSLHEFKKKTLNVEKIKKINDNRALRNNDNFLKRSKISRLFDVRIVAQNFVKMSIFDDEKLKQFENVNIMKSIEQNRLTKNHNEMTNESIEKIKHNIDDNIKSFSKFKNDISQSFFRFVQFIDDEKQYFIIHNDRRFIRFLTY